MRWITSPICRDISRMSANSISRVVNGSLGLSFLSRRSIQSAICSITSGGAIAMIQFRETCGISTTGVSSEAMTTAEAPSLPLPPPGEPPLPFC